MQNNLTLRLAQCTTAACQCMTKTPEVRYHDETCLYRVLNEAIEVIVAATPCATVREAQFEAWFAANFSMANGVDKANLRRGWDAALDQFNATIEQVASSPQQPPAFLPAILQRTDDASGPR